jgi:O-antigen/teichoic acid export membrane protein
VIVAVILLFKKLLDLENEKVIKNKEVFCISLPLLVNSMAWAVFSHANIWILALFRSESEVAIYGAAVRLMILVSFSLSLINATVPPLIAELYAKGERKILEKMLRITAFVAGVPSFVAMFLFLILGGDILAFIYGPFYRQASLVLVILSLGQLIGVWSGSCQQVLMMTGYQNILMIITTITGLLGLLVAILLVREYGILGMAAATSIGLAINNLASLIITRMKTGMWTHIGFSREAISSVKKLLLNRQS